jgi:uncharacterized protein YdhG (YjbR/CyaY superfamily)
MELIHDRSITSPSVGPTNPRADTSIENQSLTAQGARVMSAKPQTIDEYLAPLSYEKRAALEKLRKAIKSAAPGAEECISYEIPTFRLGGKMLVSFGAWANHCTFYPGSHPVETHKNELKAYDTSKGSIRFPADSPLPATLVRKLVKTRIAEYAAKKTAAASAATRRR